MSEVSQYQFKDVGFNSQHANEDEKEQWEEELNQVVDELMPHKKYRKAIIFSSIFAAIIVHILNNQVLEIVIDYEEKCQDLQDCTVEFSVENHFKGPVYIQYQIHNLLQNQRELYNSQDKDQLMGKDRSSDELKQSCGNYLTNKQMGKEKSIGDQILSEENVAIPCGLMAFTYFNDTYELYDSSNNKIPIRETGLVNKIDIEIYYKNTIDYLKNSWINIEGNEHFIIWMKPSVLSPFRKMWGVIDSELSVGNYKVIIRNQYKSSQFKLMKKVVIQQQNSFGYRKPGFVIIHYILGGVNLIILVFSIYKLQKFWREKKFHLQ